jgi:hypothetical protein
MKKQLLILTLLLLGPTPLLAGEITLSCTDPTLNDDGTPLTDFDGIKIYEGSLSGGPYVEVENVTNCAAIPILTRPPGEYFFVSTAYNTAQVESIFSNEATHIVPPVAPAPPTDLVTSGNLVAYAIQMSPDVINTYPVGTVSAGVTCNPNMSANGFYQVPTNEVAFVGGADAKVVVAECG